MRAFIATTIAGLVAVGGLAGCTAPTVYVAQASPPQPTVYVQAQTANIEVYGRHSGRVHVNGGRTANLEMGGSKTPTPDVQPPVEQPLPPAIAESVADSSIDPGASTADSIVGWSLVGAGALFMVPAYIWRHVPSPPTSPGDPAWVAQESQHATAMHDIASDVWIGAGAITGAVGAYYVYRSFVDEQPSVEVSAGPLPGGGAFSLSGTF
jgi:hypothetical protein